MTKKKNLYYMYQTYTSIVTLLEIHHQFITGMKTATYIANPKNDT